MTAARNDDDLAVLHGPVEQANAGDLDAARRWQPRNGAPSLAPLSDDERPSVADRVDELVSERVARSAAYRERIARAAYRFGVAVAAHRMTRQHAERNLRSLLFAYDPQTAVPLLIVPYRIGVRIAGDAFRRAYHQRGDQRASR
jgi:hypothetical protein